MDIILTIQMKEAFEALRGNLLASEVFVRYQKASVRLNQDRPSRFLLETLSKTQADIRQKQANGSVTQKEIDNLRRIQEQVQNNSVIMEYASTQQEAVKFLREVNTEISQLLGIDFASFTRRSGCC